MSSPDYVFDFRITPRPSDDLPAKGDYSCRMCGVEEHGGGVPNPGLYSRMRAHLREAHAEPASAEFTIVHEELTLTTARVEFTRKI